MNWDAIGAVGEVLGAGVVFVSLVYLALQIRHGTRLAESQYHSTSVANFVSIQQWKSDNPELFRKGLTDFHNLSAEERIKLDSYLHMMMYLYKDGLEAYERGFMDEGTFGAWTGFVGAHLTTPGGQVWWQDAKTVAIPKVVEAAQKAIDGAHPYQQGLGSLFDGANTP